MEAYRAKEHQLTEWHFEMWKKIPMKIYKAKQKFQV